VFHLSLQYICSSDMTIDGRCLEPYALYLPQCLMPGPVLCVYCHRAGLSPSCGSCCRTSERHCLQIPVCPLGIRLFRRRHSSAMKPTASRQVYSFLLILTETFFGCDCIAWSSRKGACVLPVRIAWYGSFQGVPGH